MTNSILISVVCVVLIVIVLFYFIAVSCAAGSYAGTRDVFKKCNCANCQDKNCADCPFCMKNSKESFGDSYLEIGRFESPNYVMPGYPMMFGEQGPPAAVESEHDTNKYLTLDNQQDMLLHELKPPGNIDYIHGFIGSKYNNDKLLYKGVW